LSLLASCVLPSCFQNETVIHLNKDGSGTLTEETAFGPQALEMLGQLAALGGGGAADADPLAGLTSEEKAKERVSKFGEGVTFEKIEAVSKGGFKGGKATYRFADINKLQLSPDDSAKSAIPEIPGAPAEVKKPSKPVTFKYNDGSLAISIPETEKPEAPAAEGAIPNPGDIGPDEEAQAKALMAGMKIAVRIVIEGGIDKTDAEHVEGNTITLNEMDFGKIVEKPGVVQKLAKLAQAGPNQALDQLKTMDGVKVETKREVSVKLK
jgi:hypothetical protein